MNRLEVFEEPSKYIEEPHAVLAIDGTPLDVLLDAACPEGNVLGLVPALLDWLSDPEERELVRARIPPTIGSSAIAPVLVCPDDLDFSCTVVVVEVVREASVIGDRVEVIVPRWIEFHDSVIQAVDAEPAGVEVRLRAYVHDWRLIAGRWRGSGWIRPVVVRLRGARAGSTPAVPVGISTGSARVGSTTHDDSLSLPFASSERTELRFELVDARRLELDANGIDIEATGEPEFVENLPDEMRPFDD